jgi:hypothetical protein
LSHFTSPDLPSKGKCVPHLVQQEKIFSIGQNNYSTIFFSRQYISYNIGSMLSSLRTVS